MKPYNKYDIFIFLLIVSLSAGIIGGSLQVPRILAILFLPAMLNIRRQCAFYTAGLKLGVAAFWVFAAVSLVWTPDLSTGVKYVAYFIVHFLLFFEIIEFSRIANYPLKAIVFGWLFFFFCVSPVSIWELLTDNHLSLSYMDSELKSNLGEGISVFRKFTSVTFGNYNTYNTILCFALPWFYYGLLKGRNLRQRLIFLLCVLLTLVFFLLNASRGAILSFVVYFSIFIFLCPNRLVKYLGITFLCTSFIILLYKIPDLLLVIGARSIPSEMSEEPRLFIWGNALKVYRDSFGIGTGAGGLLVAMEKYAMGGNCSPHNLLIELLAQYNVVFTMLFIIFLCKLLKKTFSLQDKDRRVVLLMVFFSFPAYTIINSSYLQMPSLYVFLACIYVFVNFDLLKARIAKNNSDL